MSTLKQTEIPPAAPATSSTGQPLTPSSLREVSRSAELDAQSGEPVVELVARVVGPGRKERRYLERQQELESALAAERSERLESERELELAQLIERGASRRLDKVEDQLEQERGQQKRLLLAMGAMQQELQGLRARVAQLSAPVPAPRPGLFARLFGR
jgi:hypothetical protein